MADTLDREIARINRMCIPAGERHDMVKRAKATWDCAFCGYHRDDHRHRAQHPSLIPQEYENGDD